MNKTLINTVFYTIGELLPRVISFFLLPVLTNYLSPADYGITAYTNSIITLLYIIGTLCLNSYVLRYYFIYNDESRRKELIGTSFVFIALFNLLIVGASYLFLPSIISRYNVQVAWNPYFKLAIITNCLNSFCIIPLCLYRIKQKANKYVLLNISRTILTFALNIYYVIYLNKGIEGYFYSSLYAVIPFVPIYIIIICKHASITIKYRSLKEGLRFSLPLLPGALAFFAIDAFDRILLERNVEMDQIGIYNLAATLVSAMAIVVQSGYRSFEPEIFAHYGKDDYAQYVRNVEKYFYSAIYIVAILISVFSQEFFYFFTSKGFHAAYMFVPVLMLKAILSGQNVLYSAVLQGDRKSKTVGLINITGAICSFILNLILIPIGGVWMAASVGAFSLMIMNYLEYHYMDLLNKTIWREYVLIFIYVLSNLLLFFIVKEVSMIGILIKMLVVILFSVALAILYDINFFKLFHKIRNLRNVSK